MASAAYNRGAYVIGDSSLDWAVDTISCLLVRETYTYLSTHNVISDVVAAEVSVGGYARQTLGTKTITEDDGNNRAELSAGNATFTALVTGQTAAGAIVAKNTGNDATSPLIAFLDFADLPTNGGNITVQWNAEGIVQISTV